jgi:uncharacterized protein with HEPN domain
MSIERDDATLLDIARAAQLVLEFNKGLTKDSFKEDLKSQSAILHQLMIIGEAVKRLTLEFRNTHPDIPWPLMAGMRDNLIHAYDSVDMDEVWKTATDDIPNLLKTIQPLLPSESK